MVDEPPLYWLKNKLLSAARAHSQWPKNRLAYSRERRSTISKTDEFRDHGSSGSWGFNRRWQRKFVPAPIADLELSKVHSWNLDGRGWNAAQRAETGRPGGVRNESGIRLAGRS